MRDDISVETNLFNHTEVKPHFINPNCFGEDFAEWLRGEVASLKNNGYEISDIIQEDYGWGFWISKGKDTFWIAVGMMGDGPTEEIPQWNISVNYDSGLNVFKKLFYKPDQNSFVIIRDLIWEKLKNKKDIKIV
jgi:hypothetical protein